MALLNGTSLPAASVISMPIALAEDTRRESAENLNQLLADTITLRDLYKKHHWQVSGPTFYGSSPSTWPTEPRRWHGRDVTR